MQFVDRDAAAIGCSDERANTGTSDHPDRNAFLFEDFQNADVCNAAGKSPA